MKSLDQTHSVNVGPVEIGSKTFSVIGGPCAIESLNQFLETAHWVKTQGASILRGGIYKLRTAPTSFQGLGLEAFEPVREVKKQVGLPFITEITDSRQIESLSEVADIFQVGARNMYNYALLKDLGMIRQPILLKRAFSATYAEWIKAAEYIVSGGNPNVILCERGIRTFETATRNTLDLAAVPFIKKHTSFPIIVDPSHGTGRTDLIPAMALAAVAAGADGLMLETHPSPATALSDAEQALSFIQFADLMTQIKKLLPLFDRKLSMPSFGQSSLHSDFTL